MILTHFETLPNSIKKQGRRKSKVFERFVWSFVWTFLPTRLKLKYLLFRTRSYDEMNPRTKQKCRKVPRRSSSRWLLDWNDSTRRQSWHSEHQSANPGLSDFVRFRPDQTRTDQTRPDQTRPDQDRPYQTRVFDISGVVTTPSRVP